MKPRRNMPRYVLIKLTKIKDNEKVSNATRENQQIAYKGIPIRLSVEFSAGTQKAKREWDDIFKVMKGKKTITKNIILSKDLIRLQCRNQKS